MRYGILLISVVLILSSCDEPIKIDLRQSPSKLVIDAQVTDHPGYQYVKVTRSANFYSTGKTPRVTNASIVVADDLGNAVNFVHNPNGHVDSAGFYFPAVPFVGVIGRTYTLRVTVDGTLYEASDKLVAVIPIDKLEYQLSKREKDNPKESGKIYEVLMFAREPQDVKNFYLFKFYRNDSLTFYNDTDIYSSDDDLLAENIDGVPSPVYYGLGDNARIEVYSISRIGYIFYSDLWSLLNNDAGGMFGPIPASPRTNLSNGALGFFQVSAVSIARIEIK